MKWNELSMHNNLMARNELDMKKNLIFLNEFNTINNLQSKNVLFY